MEFNYTGENGTLDDWDYWNATQLFDEGLIIIKLYPFQTVLHPIVVLLGVPLNLFVALVLVSDKRLYNARNAIWLGVVLSNLMVFFTISLEYFIFYQHSYLACQTQSLMAGKPYLILLINLCLATCDRLVYTKWPLFHKRHFTVRRVIATQLTCSIGAFTALTFHFWTRSLPVRCGIEPTLVKTTVAAMFTLTLLCIILKVVVYLEARKSQVSEVNGVITREIPLVDIVPSRRLRSRSESHLLERSRSVNRARLLVHYGSRRIRQMELNATMTLVAGLGPLCIFTVLSYLYTLGQLVCGVVSDDCETFNSLEVYFRELGLLHVSTDLLLYIFRSLEFRAAAQNFINCRFKRMFRL